MSDPNPYDAPDEVSASPETRPTNPILVRAVEYAIAILLIIALALAFLLGSR